MQNKFMKIAIKEAKKAFQAGEVPVGAVVVKDGVVISAAHNKCEMENNSLFHAEMLAINDAMKKFKKSRLDDCDLYVTLEPCVMCAGAISHARIKRLYFGAYDKIGGGVVSKLKCFDEGVSSRNIEYYCGIMEEECSKLLKEFFKEIRHYIK